MARKVSYKLLKLLFMLVMYFLSSDVVVKARDTRSNNDKIGIGVVFDHNTIEIQNAFKFAILQHTNATGARRTEYQAYVDIINTADAFKLSRLICNQFARGVFSMLGAVTPDSFDTLHSYTNTFQMPFVTPWFPEKVKPPSSGLIDHAISMRPDYHQAVIDVICFYNWKNIIYLYDSHDGLLRLQQLYQNLPPGNASFRISHVKRVTNASEAIQYLRALERLDRWSNKYVVLDCTTRLAKDVLIAHVHDVHLGRRNYHYFFSGLVMDDPWEREITEFGAINVTGFKFVDASRRVFKDFIEIWKRDYSLDYISAQAALMYDGVLVLVDAIARIQRKKPDVFRASIRRAAIAAAAGGNNTKIIDCYPPKGKIIVPFEHGDKISRMIKKTEIEGLTGDIRFDEEGHRHNFTLHVVEMNVDGVMEKVATWHHYKGLKPTAGKLPARINSGRFDRNRTYIVTTILETPYVIPTGYKEDMKTPRAYTGFCTELAEKIMSKLEIKHEIRLVKDGKYGNERPKVIGGWDGMIGELIRKEADMAIAPLTITLERERVVDFSKPFLSLDIMPIKKKGDTQDNRIFSFLVPLSNEIWVCVIFSLFGVSMVLFLVSRFSPSEWRTVSVTDTSQSGSNDTTNKPTVVNEFSFWNSMWFSIASFFQQGSGISPRSASGRIVGMVWWFFTIIVISMYTANLASHLTAERITEPLHSFGKVSACSKDASNDQGVTSAPQDISSDDQSWFSLLFDKDQGEKRHSAEADKKCEMVVSLSDTGIKEFAIAFPKRSILRNGVNLALQSLKEEGELQKLIRKWFTKTPCKETDQEANVNEMTLSQMAGIFYILVGGLSLALAVALFEFCRYGRIDATKADVSLRVAFRSKNRFSETDKSSTQSTPQDPDRLGWNGAAYGGIVQEETELHGNFAQV